MTDWIMTHWAEASAALALIIPTIIQISPIKLNPWTALARWFGRAMNGEVIEKVDKLESELQKLKATADERAAKDARARILRFGDELIHNVHHSKEHFDDILQDMSDYEHYCEKHPDFKNNRLQLTARLIKETYCKCMEEHNFM